MMLVKVSRLALAILLSGSITGQAQQPTTALCLGQAERGVFTTYRNPVINADVPDVSVCKVADTYYMVSTTMHLMPGCPVMASKDMVNWQTIGYVFDRIDDGDRYSLIDGKSVYGQGQWASSIRYHMGRFYVWFTANGAPGKGFVFSAEKPEGPWTLVSRPPHMHDGSLFFDEDGRVYMFTGSGSCRVVELKPDLSGVLDGGLNTVVVKDDPDERGGLLEGSSVVKHNGYYYLCMISMNWSIPGRLRREVCYRSRNIAGPYEKHVILEAPFEQFGGVGQGCLVGDDQSDFGWQALIFQDRGGIGRVPCLMPVTWVDGWPMCGEYKANTPETAEARLNPKNYQIPNDLSKAHPSVEGLIGSDEFDTSYTSANTGKPSLGLLWQWNHNPIDEAWSLMEHPGFLRLHTTRVVDNLNVAPNTLTQRMAGPQSTGSVCLDVSSMKDGDICGLAAFNGDSGVLRIIKKGGKWLLELTEEKSVFGEGRRIERVDVEVLKSVILNKQKGFSPKAVYLRLHGDFEEGRDLATFSYSLDGKQWMTFDSPIKMRFDFTRHFMGTKFAIFNYATKRTGGYIDVDWFHFENV